MEEFGLLWLWREEGFGDFGSSLVGVPRGAMPENAAAMVAFAFVPGFARRSHKATLASDSPRNSTFMQTSPVIKRGGEGGKIRRRFANYGVRNCCRNVSVLTRPRQRQELRRIPKEPAAST